MIFINKQIDSLQMNIIGYSNKNEIIVSVKSPRFGLRNSYGVNFQPMIKDFNSDISEDKPIIVFPLIPQYFHNFFELFPKMISLKKINKDYKAVIVFPQDKENDVFPSLVRNHPDSIINASHMKDFLEFADIDYECINSSDIEKINGRECYLFFSEVIGNSLDRTIKYDDKIFELEHFLKVPNSSVLSNYVKDLRSFFPKTPLQKNKKIFISRKKAKDRKWNLEDKVESLMLEMGYEIVHLEDMRLLDQISLLQSSEFISCLYGSALVNCSLLSSENKVLAINPTKDYEVNVYTDIFSEYSIPYTQIGAYDLGEDYLAYIGYFVEKWQKNEK